MFVNQDLRKDIKAALAGFGLAVVVGTTGTPGVVLAQEVIEEVIVTARKREETMQDVPLAVSAVGRVELESAFLSNSTAITQFAPNLIFDDISAGTPGGGGISIRGISFQDVEKTFDPTVLIHVDGVPLGTNTANVMKLLDVERVEILRGPQGTLFGKNAVGGVINIFRLKPKLNEWAGKARARVDDNNSVDFEGVLNIPLGESLAAKVNVARLDQGGYYDNVTTGDFIGTLEEHFQRDLPRRPKLLVHVSDPVTGSPCVPAGLAGCDHAATAGALYPSSYYVYLLAGSYTLADGIGRAEFGVDYTGASGVGVDVLEADSAD